MSGLSEAAAGAPAPSARKHHDRAASRDLAVLPPLLPGLAYLGAALTGRPGPVQLPDGGTPEPWVDQEALALLEAERSATPIAPLAVRHPGVTLADAYRIQWAGTALRIAGGARPVGHKVGLTSAAMREQMGIDDPDSGVLLDDMVVPSGTELAVAGLVCPRIEAEFAFRLGGDLVGEAVDLDAARGAVAQVMVALEVIDTRYQDWQITLEDSVADNAACARIVTGPPVAFEAGMDLREQVLSVRVDGAPAATGAGREVLGDPLASVAWLARRLAAFGTGLRGGDIVLAGSVHGSLPLSAGTHVDAVCAALPPVSVRTT
ncbi:fumarylacetoacetate hydrolase family protein [Kitasatospora sp. GP82]|uniref:2-keto-4-pentenoate hydratase n=1 Tax=Kitasatospora sp. GP82 TaxID=3035089 RepID=UPI0024735BB0|nr:fumarylacetoacetate hydrolase family protein [Kitasatospora sp. GP82]MDH6130255.1 2-keto-4-pentenoate hydratase [Kitasatospora sp. GP82]